MWRLKDKHIVNERGEKVIEVSGNKDNENQNVIAYKKNTNEGQKWTILYADDEEKDPQTGDYSAEWGLFVGRPFHIVSTMSSKRYVDLISNRSVIKTANGFDTQKFVFDWATRSIKSVKNKQSLDARNTFIYTYASNNQWYQNFKFEGGLFVNVQNKKVFDAQDGKDAEGQYVTLLDKTGKASQKWSVVYSDEVKVQTKGVNKEFGWEINRPFYIVSKMWMNRVITVTGGSNLVIKTREGKG